MNNTTKLKIKSCPCGNLISYEACCQPYHNGSLAPNAEILMRSRYTAYTLELFDYLYSTWHPTTCPKDLGLDHSKITWLGLKIIKSWQINEQEAFVEFIARSRIGGQPAHRLHETSRFIYENEMWLYIDGTFASK